MDDKFKTDPYQLKCKKATENNIIKIQKYIERLNKKP